MAKFGDSVFRAFYNAYMRTYGRVLLCIELRLLMAAVAVELRLVLLMNSEKLII